MKNTSHIKSSFVSNGLIVCLLLLMSMSTAVRAKASCATDSVRFHIHLDTLGGLRAGRVLKLTYALLNSPFDSVSPPVFNAGIEVLDGPKPHKSSSYALVNGVESKSHEAGFYYLVRFRQSGEIQLPSASVKAGNRTYVTPECRVYVHPPEADISRLKCRLRVEQLKSDYAKYRAILTCNARPDQNPPLLTINGEAARPNSNAYSTSEGKEEYTYTYYFTGEGYEVSCGELTFGGIPYFVKPRKSKIDHVDFFILIAIAGALFELTGWLVCRWRYREEKEAALAAFVLEKKTLPLNTSWAYTHYGASHTLLLFSALFVAMTGVTLYAANLFTPVFFWLGIAFVPPAYVLYRSQRRKLDFQSIPTSLDKQAIYDRIYNLSITYDWDVDHYGEDCIVAHTNPSFWSATWGELIFIVFDQGQVWVNSVNDLNRRTSICSFGHNKRNIRRIREVLTQGAAIRD